MPNTKEIRIRIKAIGSTAKITKAMEMVAASKMKKSQDAATKNRAYAQGADEILGHLMQDEKISHPLISRNDKVAQKLLIVITSDKGLCGAYNAAVVRQAILFLKDNINTDIIVIGKKGQKLLHALGQNVIAAYADLPIFIREHDIAPIVTRIEKDYKLQKYQTVSVCYTDFISTLKQTPKLKQLMPFSPGRHSEMVTEESPTNVGLKQVERSFTTVQDDKPTNFKFEPTPQEVINYVVPRIIETQFYQMMLEAIASEQSARMMAMKNATDAARDLIDDLQLTYNSLRQGSITQELAEISAAVNS